MLTNIAVSKLFLRRLMLAQSGEFVGDINAILVMASKLPG